MKGKLFVLSGPSGCGKSTVISGVMKQYENLRFSVSATTRPIRPGETDGKDYYFVTKEAFLDMLQQGALLEHARYVDNYYGTPAAPVQKLLDDGFDVLLDIEPQGAMQVRACREDAVLLFLAPPSLKTLEARLRGRGDTAPDLVEKRLKQAAWEFTQAEKYDYIIVNDELETAVKEVLSVLTAEKCRTKERIALLKDDL